MCVRGCNVCMCVCMYVCMYVCIAITKVCLVQNIVRKVNKWNHFLTRLTLVKGRYICTLFVLTVNCKFMFGNNSI